VDCRDVCETKPDISDVRHQYYRKRPEVVADVRQVLAGMSPDQIPNRTYVAEKRSYRIGAR
jgi:hypothetical protein